MQIPNFILLFPEIQKSVQKAKKKKRKKRRQLIFKEMIPQLTIQFVTDSQGSEIEIWVWKTENEPEGLQSLMMALSKKKTD